MNIYSIPIIVGAMVSMVALLLVQGFLADIVEAGSQNEDYESFTALTDAISNECATAASGTDDEAFKGDSLTTNLKQHNIKVEAGTPTNVILKETASDNREESREICSQSDISSVEIVGGGLLNGNTIPTGPRDIEIIPDDSGEVEINVTVSG
jgi:hypothetical protein